MSRKLKKIGILGGTFDPCHLGHLKISKEAKIKFKLTKVIWAITKKNPFKKKSNINLENRIKNSKKFTKKYKFIQIRYFEKLIKSIKPLIPISFEKIRVAVKIRAIHVGKCYGQISSLANIESEEYQKDGSWIGILEMPAASFVKLEDVLGSLTKGTAETKML